MQRTARMLKYLAISTFAFVTILNTGPLTQSATAEPCQPKGSILGFPTWYEYLDGEYTQGKCSPIINASKDALPIGLAIFDIALTLSGLVAVVMIFVGAARYIISVGEPAKAATAQHTIINALVGLVIILLASRVVSFIAGKVF